MSNQLLYEGIRGLLDSGKNWEQITRAMKSQGLVGTSVDTMELRKIYRELVEKSSSVSLAEFDSFDKKIADFFKFIGKERANIQKSKIERTADADENTIIISDVHIPYQNDKALFRMLEETKGIAKKLVIAGDFMNGNQLSKHPKVLHEDFRVECQEARKWLEIFSADFEEVVLMDDNHISRRWNDHLADTWRPDLHFLAMHPYDYITAGLENVTRAGVTQMHNFSDETGWFYQQGDAVFTHAELHTANPFAITAKIKSWLNEWKRHFNMGDIRLVGQAHNHNVGVLHSDDGMQLFTGCMLSLDAVRYSMSAKCAGKPPVLGYVVLNQKNGVTDLEKTRVQRLYDGI
jgi:ribosomal protein L18E